MKLFLEILGAISIFAIPFGLLVIQYLLANALDNLDWDYMAYHLKHPVYKRGS
jgi:hypothetical protein